MNHLEWLAKHSEWLAGVIWGVVLTWCKVPFPSWKFVGCVALLAIADVLGNNRWEQWH